jgi:hypothetical protein
MELSIRSEIGSRLGVRWQTAIVLLLLVAAILAPRLMGLDQYVTPDEAAWAVLPAFTTRWPIGISLVLSSTATRE